MIRLARRYVPKINSDQTLTHAVAFIKTTKMKNARKKGQQMQIGIQAALFDSFLANGSQSRQISGGLARLALV